MISGNIGGFNLNFVLNSKNWWYKMIGKILNKVINPIITSIIKFVNLALGVNLSRYFVTLDPVLNSYYEMAQPITFAGDFEVEVEFSTTSASGYDMLFSNSTSAPYITVKNNKFVYLFASGEIVGSIAVTDGKLNKAKLIRVGATVSLYINGVLDGTSTNSTSLRFVNIGKYWSSNFFFDGIIANAKFTDKSGASDVVTTFRLDNSPAAENYTYSTELLENNTFPDNANARQYLVSSKGWIITDGGAA